MGYEKVASVAVSRRRLAAFGTSSRSNSSCFAMEKIVVFAPIASASETTATSVNPGLLRSRRAANTRSGGSKANIGIIYPKTIINDRRGFLRQVGCAHGDDRATLRDQSCPHIGS